MFAKLPVMVRNQWLLAMTIALIALIPLAFVSFWSGSLTPAST